MRDDNDPLNAEGSPEELLNELDSIKELLDEELQQERATPATSIEEIGSVEEYLRIKQAADDAGLSMEAYLAAQQQAAEETIEIELLEDEEESIPLLDEVIELEDSDGETEAEPGGDDLLLELAEEEDHAPSTTEATTVEEYFAAVVAAKHNPQDEEPAVTPPAEEAVPLLDEVVDTEAEPPLLDEVVDTEAQIPLLDEVVSEEAVPEDEAIPLLAEVASDEEGRTGPDEQAMSLDEMQELVDLLVNRKLQQLKPELEKEVMAELQKLLPISALTKS